MKFFGAILLALAFFYTFYTGAMAAWSYFRMSDVVEQALQDQARAGALPVRGAVLRRAAEAGVPIDDRHVVVLEEEGTLRVLVRWRWPVISYGGDEVLALPLSLERSRARR